jgi:hypothetical protein
MPNPFSKDMDKYMSRRLQPAKPFVYRAYAPGGFEKFIMFLEDAWYGSVDFFQKFINFFRTRERYNLNDDGVVVIKKLKSPARQIWEKIKSFFDTPLIATTEKRRLWVGVKARRAFNERKIVHTNATIYAQTREHAQGKLRKKSYDVDAQAIARTIERNSIQ